MNSNTLRKIFVGLAFMSVLTSVACSRKHTVESNSGLDVGISANTTDSDNVVSPVDRPTKGGQLP